MGTIAEKLTYLNGTKQAIKQAIIDKGVAVADSDTFRSYAAKIAEIPTGSAQPQPDGYTGVFFYDYNGDLLHWYSVEDAQALTALPPINVQHERLVSEGWTHTLEEVKATTFRLDVGAMYHTASGNLEYKVVIDLPGQICYIGVYGGTVDWGDGTVNNWYSSIATHTYNTPGTYYVECSGTLKYDPNNRTSFTKNVKEIYLNTVAASDFYYGGAYNIEALVIPAGTTSIDIGSFGSPNSLRFLVIPKSLKTLTSGFNELFTIESIIIPTGMISYSAIIKQYRYNIRHLVLPDADNPIVTLASYSFENWYNLQYLIIPEGLTEVKSYCFSGLINIRRIILPSTLITINNRAFYKAMPSDGIIIKATNPPTLSGVPDGTLPSSTIYVPDASVEAYKTATNWATMADNIKPMSEIGL